MKGNTPRFARAMTFLFPLLAIGLSIVALYFAAVRSEGSEIVITGGQNSEGAVIMLEQAELALERANDAVGSAELILSFLEGGSILAGVILVGAGILGVSSIQDLRHDTEAIKQEMTTRIQEETRELIARLERAERELLRREEQLAKLESQLEQSIASNQSRIDEQIQTASKMARRSFEALSQHVMAQRLARENNVEAAIKACRDSHDLDPDNVPNNYLLGTLLLRRGNLDESIEHLTEAFTRARVSGEDASVPAQAALGLALRYKGDQTTDPMERNRLYNQAEHYLLEATRSDPQLLTDDRESYFGVLGSLYRRQGRTLDAIQVYHRAAEMTPRRSYPQINLAMLYLNNHDPNQAEKYRQSAEAKARRRLEDTPEDYWAWHDVALSQLLGGNVDEAMRHFNEGIELSPDISSLESVLARLIYIKQIAPDLGGLDKAIQHFQESIRLKA
ncbi:MAG: hypothetical protein KJ064_21005 [Anaerolineae bacterium]|nr:hypothetical protein [Anaerolineae bacterium]